MSRLPFDQNRDDHLHVTARQKWGIRLLCAAAWVLWLAAVYLLSEIVPPEVRFNATVGAAILLLLLNLELVKELRRALYRRARQQNESQGAGGATDNAA